MVKFGLEISHGGLNYSYYEQLIRECEELNFDSVWVFDHFYFGNKVRECMEAWTLLSALAHATKKLRLGFLVICNSFRHPSLLARMASTLDNISNGRLEFGIGAGWYKEEHRAFGFDFPPVSVRIARLEESIKICKLLWTKDRVTFHGKYYTLENAISNLKPIQKPHPPILVGGSGEKLLRVVARHADASNIEGHLGTHMMTLDEYKNKMEILEKHCEDVGRNFNEIEKTFSIRTIIAETDKKIRKKLKNFALELNLPLEDYLRKIRVNSCLIGTPDLIAKKLEELTEAGVERFLLQFFDYVDVSSIRLLADEVVSKFMRRR